MTRNGDTDKSAESAERDSVLRGDYWQLDKLVRCGDHEIVSQYNACIYKLLCIGEQDMLGGCIRLGPACMSSVVGSSQSCKMSVAWLLSV